jgi:integrase/recombinase XerC
MIEDFLNYLRLEKAYSPHTATSYGNDLREFEAYLANTENVLELKDADADLVRGWAMHLMAMGRNATTVNRKLSSLRTFYKYLLKKEVIAVSPLQSVRGPKKKRPLPQFVREADMERLLDGTLTDDSWRGRREHVIIQLFYETGIRLSELVGLNVGDVDFDRKAIKVTGKRNKQRIIPIGDGLAQNLKEYVETRLNPPCEEGVSFVEGSSSLPRREGWGGSPLFITDKGQRVYPAWVYRLVRKNLSQVVTLKKRSPHVLRHTFATAMLNGEAELEAVKELMGHESVSTTQIYTHTTFEELKKAYSKAHPRASINQ